MSQSYTTRAEAAAPPAHLVRLMTVAHYDSERARTGWPDFDGSEPSWQASRLRDMRAALIAAETDGYGIGLHLPTSTPARPNVKGPGITNEAAQP